MLLEEGGIERMGLQEPQGPSQLGQLGMGPQGGAQQAESPLGAPGAAPGQRSELEAAAPLEAL